MAAALLSSTARGRRAPCPPGALLSMVPTSHSLPLPARASSPGRRRQDGECLGWAGLYLPASAPELCRAGLPPLRWVRAGRLGRHGGFPIPGWQRRARGKGKGGSGAFGAGGGVCAAAVTGFSPCPPGERAENPPDLLQEMRQASAAQGHAVQEGEGLALRAG